MYTRRATYISSYTYMYNGIANIIRLELNTENVQYLKISLQIGRYIMYTLLLTEQSSGLVLFLRIFFKSIFIFVFPYGF